MVSTSEHLLKKFENELQSLPHTKRLLEQRLGKHSTGLNEHLAKRSLKDGNIARAVSLIAKDPIIGMNLGKKGMNKLWSIVSAVAR